MKASTCTSFALVLLAALSLQAASQEKITTLTGKTYRQCEIVRVYPDGISFTHANGAAKVLFSDLSQEWRQRLGYDPAKAAAYQREQEALRRVAVEKRDRDPKVIELELHPTVVSPLEEDAARLGLLEHTKPQNGISSRYYPDLFTPVDHSTPSIPLELPAELRVKLGEEKKQAEAQQAPGMDPIHNAHLMEVARLRGAEIQARAQLEAAAKAPLPNPPLVPVLPELGATFDSSDYRGVGYRDSSLWYFPGYYGYGGYPLSWDCYPYYPRMGAELRTRIGGVTLTIGP